jgi:hypothetical protein
MTAGLIFCWRLRRIDNELKYGLVSEITDGASTLYHHIAMYLDVSPGGVAARSGDMSRVLCTGRAAVFAYLPR